MILDRAPPRRNEKPKYKQISNPQYSRRKQQDRLASHTINDGKKWFKMSLKQVDSRTKGVHVELATDSMEEETNIITEVMKGDSVNIYIW